MPILLKNESGTIPECNSGNKSIFDKRLEEANTDISAIKHQLENYRLRVYNSTDIVIQNFARATSFPIADIQRLIEANPNCTYLRVYNGITDDGDFVTYCAPISSDFNTYINDQNSIISQSCCQCKPCTSDTLLN